MTEVTPPLENTRFSPFFDFTVYDHPAICALCFFIPVDFFGRIRYDKGKQEQKCKEVIL